ncbi:DUF5110 domain-containing protein [Catenovulum sp. 2E275]|uniref:glycoside hydrolase family 31 protein n=1 Tax=Catenovulum sp. 2E275 TaxID=2980497 RepID=UPI0021D0139A|nr:TIM-barrel domain-containing protein [Catenovulum sp. 2E275]MCU4676093.1 DUF5110 domain-containing protein [Catenovulum sp. 2E275]
MIMFFKSRFGQTVLFSSLAVLFSSQVANAREYISHQISGDNLIIQTDDGQIKLDYLTDYSVEVSFKAKADNSAQINASFSLLESFQDVAVTLEQNQTELKFNSAQLTALIQKSPLKIQYLQQGKLLVSEADGFIAGGENTAESGQLTHKTKPRGVEFKLSQNEKILGGGERVLGMDRRGYRLPLYNKAHYGYGAESEQMNYGLPAVYSSKQYMILFDNPASGWLDIGKTKADILSFEAEQGRLSYVVIGAENYADLTNQYTKITGRQPMPPRWALGYIASRFGYHTEQEARETLTLFKQNDFPVDAIIFDLYWFGKDVQGHMGNLDWDYNAFPNPEKMIADFKKDGINTVLITEPFILTSSKKWQDAVDNQILALDSSGQAKTFDFYFGNTGLIDIFKPQAKDWFWDIYHNLMQQGVEGWWGDLGEPEVHPADALHQVNGKTVNANAIHNAYGHEWAKTLYQNYQQDYPNKRPFILMRSGFTGSQRFGMIPWTGDVGRNWDGLKPQVELSLQMSLFGLAYTHSDLGGFAGDNWDEELYIRWLQYGVFQPIYRPHAQEAVAPEPVFHSEKVQNITRQSIKLRYQLMPYLYTMAFENSQTGKPLMQPLFFASEQIKDIDNRYDYLWGDAFFVSPVIEPGVTEKSIELPAGIWFDFYTDQKLSGNQTHKLAINIESIPAFVKAGSFVPMVDAVNNAASYSSEQLTLHYYHDDTVTKASAFMYEDDGKTADSFNQGMYEKLLFNSRFELNKANSESKLMLDLSREQGDAGYQNMPDARSLNLIIHHAFKPKLVAINDQALALVDTYQQFITAQSAVWFNLHTKQLMVKLNWQVDQLSVVIK